MSAPTQRRGTYTVFNYLRWAGVGVGVVLIVRGIWALKSWAELPWLGWFQFLVMAALGGFYIYSFATMLLGRVVPLGRGGYFWEGCLLLSLLTILFAFSQIAEVVNLHYLAGQAGQRMRVPAFQGILLFVTALQFPVWIFNVRPDWLD